MASYVQDYSFTIAAGGSQVLNCDAFGITCIESNLTEFQIEINDGPRATFRRQFEFAAERGDTIKKFRIINPATVPLVVRFLVWRGLFRDRRSLANEVQGIDPQTFDDIAEQAFMVIGGTTAVGGADYGAVQLLNPAGSGKVIAVLAVDVSADTATLLRLFEYSTPLTTLERMSYSVVLSNGDGVGEMRRDVAAAQLYTGDLTTRKRIRVGANDAKRIEFIKPLFLLAGDGLAMQPNILGVDIDFNAEILEIDG